MKIVQPETKTSLLLNKHYQAFAFCTARAAIRHLITERVRGMDADGNVFGWEGDISWKEHNISVYPDQPCLRSAHEVQWAIPTILICTHHFGYHRRKGENVSLRKLYSVYKGICQYCLKPIPYHLASRDHHIPRVAGGHNGSDNLVLACKKCNNEKDSTFPYYDVNGNLVKPKHILTSGVFLPDIEHVREEWKPFLYKD